MKLPRKVWILLGVVLLVVVVIASLPFLIDVNRYRDFVESRARDALGRDVRLGEMQVSLWPVFGLRIDDVAIAGLPEEGGGELVTADSLRLGAKLFPLLRKRLEVTTIVLQSPRLVLERGPDGRWNVERLIATGDTDATSERPASSAPADFRVDRLRIVDGILVLRDRGPGREHPAEIVLDSVSLRVDDFALDESFDLELSASLQGAVRSKLALRGRGGPLARPADEPLPIVGELTLDSIDPQVVVDFASGFVPVSPEFFGSRPFSASTKLTALLGAGGRIDVTEIVVEGLEVDLKRDRQGHWNVPIPAKEESGPATTGDASAAMEIAVAGIRLEGCSLRVTDESAPGDPLQLSLAEIDLTLDRLPFQQAAVLELSAKVGEGNDVGALTVRGGLGPLEGNGGDVPLELEVRLGPVPRAVMRAAFGEETGLDLESVKTSVDVKLAGRLYHELSARGSLEMRGARVEVPRPDGTTASSTIDAGARFDVTSFETARRVAIRALDLDLDGRTLQTRGSIAQEGELYRVDVELLPARIPADDLATLVALVTTTPPVLFSSPTPIELQGRARGLLGGDRLPEVDGQAKLRDFSFRHPALSAPLQNVNADARLGGSRLDVSGLTGLLGSTDLAGEVTIDTADAIRVTIDLRSTDADLGEMLSFLADEGGESTGSTPASTTGTEAQTTAMRIDGRLRIDAGKFDTLDFRNMDGRLSFVDNVFTLDPLTMDLYAGAFKGRVVADVSGAEPVFEIDGEADGVDTGAFLADNLETPNLLTGEFSGRVETRGAGIDYESIVRGLKGEGSMKVLQGRVGGLDVLKTLSKVSGVFGESTLRRLSDEIAADGTGFSSLTSGLALGDGRLQFRDLRLQAAEFQLEGDGFVDLLRAELDGVFKLSLSSAISGSMRAEDSRAARLFWNSRSSRVELPFTLSGPFNAPRPGIDFESVARTALRGRAEDELRNRIGERLGIRPSDDAAGQAPAQPGTPPSPPADDSGAAPAEPTAPAGDPAALTTDIRHRWSGPILARDLRLAGTIRGKDLASASLAIVDAAGQAVQGESAIPEVAAAGAASASGDGAAVEVPWEFKVDGKRLLLAKFPVTVRVKLESASGSRAELTQAIDR